MNRAPSDTASDLAGAVQNVSSVSYRSMEGRDCYLASIADEQASAAHDLADQARDLAETALHRARDNEQDIEALRRELRRLRELISDRSGAVRYTAVPPPPVPLPPPTPPPPPAPSPATPQTPTTP